MRIAVPFLLPVLVAWPCTVLAQVQPQVVVERSAGAEECPDGPTLGARVEQILGRPTAATRRSYRVLFSRSGDMLTAVIRPIAESTEARELESRGGTCDALTQATAVTLALLFDVDFTEAEAAASAPSPPAPPPVRHPPALRSSTAGSLSVGGGEAVGFASPVAPALLGEIGVDAAGWRIRLGALWTVPQTLALGRGRVRQSLLTETTRICYAWHRIKSWRFDICSGVFVGGMTGQAIGYSQNGQGTSPWVAFPFEVGAAATWGTVGWEVGAAAVAPLRPDEFSIESVGISYRAPPIGALFAVRASGFTFW